MRGWDGVSYRLNVGRVHQYHCMADGLLALEESEEESVQAKRVHAVLLERDAFCADGKRERGCCIILTLIDGIDGEVMGPQREAVRIHLPTCPRVPWFPPRI